MYNKYQNVYTSFDGKKYILLRVIINKNNRLLVFKDLFFISEKIDVNYHSKIDYFELWEKKLSYVENYLSNVSSPFYSNYFLGLGEISLNILRKINFSNLTLGLFFKKNNINNMLYDLLNPCNLHYGPIVNSFSEFIKFSFFDSLDYDFSQFLISIFSLSLTDDDYLFLLARLIFPSYYFHFLSNQDGDLFLQIDKVEKYFLEIKRFVLEIKKRNINIPFIDYIINQL